MTKLRYEPYNLQKHQIYQLMHILEMIKVADKKLLSHITSGLCFLKAYTGGIVVISFVKHHDDRRKIEMWNRLNIMV